MEASNWLGSVGIRQILVGNSETHPGLVELHAGVSLSHAGEMALQKHLKAKVKRVDSIVATDHTIKVVAQGPTVLTDSELKRLARSSIASINAWASTLNAEDIILFTSMISEQQIIRAMATSSKSNAFHGADKND